MSRLPMTFPELTRSFPQYAQPVTKKGGRKDAPVEGEEEKKQSQHVVRKLEERKKGTSPRVDSRVNR